jgi:hypothetical protein
VNFNVNFNVLLSKYIVHPLVKIKKDIDIICIFHVIVFVNIIMYRNVNMTPYDQLNIPTNKAVK